MCSADEVSSRLGSFRGWRCCLSALVVGVLLTIPRPAHAAQLTLSWADASTNEDGFKVERKTGAAGAYGQLATVGAETTGYVDATVLAGTTYCYRVRAYNSAGDSAYSNEACAAPPGATLYPVTVSRAGAGSGTVVSSPSALDCGSTCSASLASGTSLALAATPAAGSTFAGWSGACTGPGPCTLVVSGTTSLTATFALAPSSYTLTLTTTGTGSGTVTSSPVGLNCGSTCSATYSYNTSVTLTASPGTGSTFSGWSGACSGTGACTVTVDRAKSVTANFALGTYTLTVGKAGTGNGTVTSSPTGISCGSNCGLSFTVGTSVTLTAAPATGSTFTGWSGACTGTGTCTVTMGAAQSVTATFTAQTYALTATKAGTGSGTVTSSPTGIACGTTCAAGYGYNTAVTLTAAPATGSTFTGWSGACTGTGSCTVTMTAAQTVTASFTAAPPSSTYTLNVSRIGVGTGIVASNPAGINCGAACSASFTSGAMVTLEAMPDGGSTFTGWSGACAGAGSCTVSMDQAQNVTVTFDRQTVALTVTNTGTDLGRVISNPAGIDCGTACSYSVPSGTAVTLSAKPTKFATFVSWSGACAGKGTCTVALTQAKNVTATFKRKDGK